MVVEILQSVSELRSSRAQLAAAHGEDSGPCHYIDALLAAIEAGKVIPRQEAQ